MFQCFKSLFRFSFLRAAQIVFMAVAFFLISSSDVVAEKNNKAIENDVYGVHTKLLQLEKSLNASVAKILQEVSPEEQLPFADLTKPGAFFVSGKFLEKGSLIEVFLDFAEKNKSKYPDVAEKIYEVLYIQFYNLMGTQTFSIEGLHNLSDQSNIGNRSAAFVYSPKHFERMQEKMRMQVLGLLGQMYKQATLKPILIRAINHLFMIRAATFGYETKRKYLNERLISMLEEMSGDGEKLQGGSILVTKLEDWIESVTNSTFLVPPYKIPWKTICKWVVALAIIGGAVGGGYYVYKNYLEKLQNLWHKWFPDEKENASGSGGLPIRLAVGGVADASTQMLVDRINEMLKHDHDHGTAFGALVEFLNRWAKTNMQNGKLPVTIVIDGVPEFVEMLRAALPVVADLALDVKHLSAGIAAVQGRGAGALLWNGVPAVERPEENDAIRRLRQMGPGGANDHHEIKGGELWKDKDDRGKK